MNIEQIEVIKKTMNTEMAAKILNLKKKITSRTLAELKVSDTDDLEKLFFAIEALDRLISKNMGYSKNS